MYEMSQKVIDRNNRQTNWERRLTVLRLRNQGWEFHKIGEHLGVSKQAVYHMWSKVKDMSVAEAEEYADKFGA